jgi:hypothetical protein
MTHLRRLLRLCVLLVAVAMTATIVPGGLLSSARASGALLPNLVADPVDGFEMQEATFKDKTKHLLLRFNGYIHNKGPGAVDFRGSREAPSVKESTLKAIERHEEFTSEQEAELANPPMETTQRLFTTNAEESNMNRPHVEEPSNGKLIYSSADGHNHWHLQEIAKYTLMNAAKTGVVAPAQKVGFCLDDTEGQHVETNIGPSSPVYSDNAGRKFCREWEPNTKELWEGISPGWRDKYNRGLALQWVDVSNVQPGSYQLRDEVNPLGFVKEEPGENTPAFTPVTVPGYVAQSQSVTTPFQTAKAITLTVGSFAPKHGATFQLVAGPSHGSLSGSGTNLTYTPAPGFSGSDSFRFWAREESSRYPESPQPATVSIEVGENPSVPSVRITSAPSSLVAGTSGPLTAESKNDAGGIEWSASGGATVRSESINGERATLTAPPQAGTIAVTARLADNPAVLTTQEVAVAPTSPAEPVPGLPPVTLGGGTGTPNGGVQGTKTVQQTTLTKPRAMLVGRYAELSTRAGLAGRVRLSLYARKHLLGTCASITPGGRTFTCRLKLSRPRLDERLRVIASLRSGSRLLVETLGPERIPKMVMVRAGNLRGGAHAASYSSMFWCDPSTVIAALAGGE